MVMTLFSSMIIAYYYIERDMVWIFQILFYAALASSCLYVTEARRYTANDDRSPIHYHMHYCKI